MAVVGLCMNRALDGATGALGHAHCGPQPAHARSSTYLVVLVQLTVELCGPRRASACSAVS